MDELKDIPKTEMRELLLAIAQTAKKLPPMLQTISVADANGEPTTLEDVMLLVNPKDGSVSFWNINALWERTVNDFRSVEMATNNSRRQLIELDEEIRKRREVLANYEARMPRPRGGFDIN